MPFFLRKTARPTLPHRPVRLGGEQLEIRRMMAGDATYAAFSRPAGKSETVQQAYVGKQSEDADFSPVSLTLNASSLMTEQQLTSSADTEELRETIELCVGYSDNLLG